MKISVILAPSVRVNLRPHSWEGQAMKLTKSILLTSGLLLSALAASAAEALPNPVLYMTGSEYYTAGGKNWVRHRYDVFNKDQYPDSMFAAAPALPPCGLNHNSSRSWIDIFDSRGNRLYGFCALGKASDLGSIWFSTEDGVVPPSYIYIEINDRQTNTKYKSNLADTTM
jgi:hypothetical protein